MDDNNRIQASIDTNYNAICMLQDVLRTNEILCEVAEAYMCCSSAPYSAIDSGFPPQAIEQSAAIIQGMKKARPDLDVFFDVDSLRNGDDWERDLHEEIERRDVLFLCWSHFARESKWVMNAEWRIHI